MSATQAPAEEREAPPCSPALVEDMFKLLDKAVRAHQLYMHNNPTYLKAVENVKKSFVPLWAELDNLVITVTETRTSRPTTPAR